MQTRDELYDYLDYHPYEHKLDELFAKEKQRMSDDATPRLPRPNRRNPSPVRRPGRQHRAVHRRRAGNDLHYRGYDILDFAEKAEFEEIAYLLVHGKLPTRPSWPATSRS